MAIFLTLFFILAQTSGYNRFHGRWSGMQSPNQRHCNRERERPDPPVDVASTKISVTDRIVCGSDNKWMNYSIFDKTKTRHRTVNKNSTHSTICWFFYPMPMFEGWWWLTLTATKYLREYDFLHECNKKNKKKTVPNSFERIPKCKDCFQLLRCNSRSRATGGRAQFYVFGMRVSYIQYFFSVSPPSFVCALL